MFWHHGRELMNAYMLNGPGLSHLISYFTAAVLACIGYGSLFLAAGVLFRNPLIPAAGLLVWESINGFLPALLKKLSVIYWLQSICPIALPVAPAGRNNILALLVIDIDPAPARLAIMNLILIASFRYCLGCSARPQTGDCLRYGLDMMRQATMIACPTVHSI